MEQLYFADEVDAPERVLAGKLPRVQKRELDLALQLIESFAGDWKPEKYADTYTDALKAIVRRKRKGEAVHRVREPDEEEQAPDLLEALRLSLEQNGKRRPKRKRTKAVASAK